MFDIFVKRKKLVLDCFTDKPYIYNFAKVDHGAKFYPEWWKKTPSVENQGLTIKHCSALIEFYKRGLVIPSWFSLNIYLSEERNIEWYASNADQFKFESHAPEQFKLFHQDDGLNFKILSEWKFKTNRKVWFSWTQPTWSMRHYMFNMSVLPGVINFYNQHSTNMNFFLQFTDKLQVIEIEPLQPLIMLHPMSECDVEIKQHLVGSDEIRSLHFGVSRFIFGIQNLVGAKKWKPQKTFGEERDAEELRMYRKSKRLKEKILDIAHSDENKQPYHYITERNDGKQK